MRSLLTRLTESIDKKIAHRNENIIDEGMSMNDFKKFMNTCKRKGVNFNRMSATQLMYTLYRNLDRKDFTAIAQQLDEISKQQVITSCGGYHEDDDNYYCGRPSRRTSWNSCGPDNDRYC